MKTFYTEDIKEWREWLVKHHGDESEVWLIFNKKASGLVTLNYHDALDEALCFGWVDSLIKKIDDAQYARKFTPRKSGSQWSEINIKRADELIRQGRMRPEGFALYQESAANKAPTSLERKQYHEKCRSELMGLLDKEGIILFSKLAPSHQGQYAAWIMSAKRIETRDRRLAEMLSVLKKGERLGLK